MPEVGMMGTSRRAGRQQIEPILGATARFLREPDGPNVAAVEFSGWDTHANQGQEGGQLDRLLGQLARGILTFKSQVGSTWDQTTVVVMTEFGRTARPNGTGGTDHGTAGAGLIIGPGLSRSRVLSDWPGLANKALYENPRSAADSGHSGRAQSGCGRLLRSQSKPAESDIPRRRSTQGNTRSDELISATQRTSPDLGSSGPWRVSAHRCCLAAHPWGYGWPVTRSVGLPPLTARCFTNQPTKRRCTSICCRVSRGK